MEYLYYEFKKDPKIENKWEHPNMQHFYNEKDLFKQVNEALDANRKFVIYEVGQCLMDRT